MSPKSQPQLPTLASATCASFLTAVTQWWLTLCPAAVKSSCHICCLISEHCQLFNIAYQPVWLWVNIYWAIPNRRRVASTIDLIFLVKQILWLCSDSVTKGLLMPFRIIGKLIPHETDLRARRLEKSWEKFLSFLIFSSMFLKCFGFIGPF